MLCEDDEQRAKVEAARRVPRLQHVLTYADLDDPRGAGRAYAAAHPDALAEAGGAIDEDDLFTFIYTSGTTGPPKGCMIRTATTTRWSRSSTACRRLRRRRRHDAPLPAARAQLRAADAPRRRRTSASRSPSSPDPLAVAAALPAVRPTVLPSVPARVREGPHRGRRRRSTRQTGAKRRLIDWALRVGRRVSELRQDGQPVPRALALQHRLADRLVFAQGEGAARRTAAARRSPAARRSRRRSPSSSTRSTSASSRATG